ncbi:hypothetical protein GWK47_031251 [Chionoecetes opilio]|uniref:Uncharacterized protein n=1 Tax=Chionoecetes opilio TaxID=41210 RepID=A0A8J5D4W1_CHIOP|nr:hypothetical protein GWK47_031251 [Chionoecetes opilio]
MALKGQKEDEEEADAAPRKRARRSEQLKFNFFEHCIFCGEDCQVKKDPKYPPKWKPAYLCRQVNRPEKKMSLKTEILAKCDERNDDWAAQVRIRVSGAISDLHAADARYHVACRTNFMSSRSTSAAVKEAQADKPELDKGLQVVISILKEDMSHIWNSVDLFNLYIENEGNALSRRQLIVELSAHFGKDLVVLSSPGIASILAFQSKAADVLRIIPDAEEDDTGIAIHKSRLPCTMFCGQSSIECCNYQTRTAVDEDDEDDY